MNLYAFISLASACISLFLGAMVFARDTRNRVNILFLASEPVNSFETKSRF
jgi:hypothetical protein